MVTIDVHDNNMSINISVTSSYSVITRCDYTYKYMMMAVTITITIIVTVSKRASIVRIVIDGSSNTVTLGLLELSWLLTC